MRFPPILRGYVDVGRTSMERSAIAGTLSCEGGRKRTYDAPRWIVGESGEQLAGIQGSHIGLPTRLFGSLLFLHFSIVVNLVNL